MPENAYDRLSFLDNSFLIMETPTSPMHVAGTATFEAGPLQTADGGIDIDKIRDYVASRQEPAAPQQRRSAPTRTLIGMPAGRTVAPLLARGARAHQACYGGAATSVAAFERLEIGGARYGIVRAVGTRRFDEPSYGSVRHIHRAERHY